MAKSYLLEGGKSTKTQGTNKVDALNCCSKSSGEKGTLQDTAPTWVKLCPTLRGSVGASADVLTQALLMALFK